MLDIPNPCYLNTKNEFKEQLRLMIGKFIRAKEWRIGMENTNSS